MFNVFLNKAQAKLSFMLQYMFNFHFPLKIKRLYIYICELLKVSNN